jgi:hypothetical protein
MRKQFIPVLATVASLGLAGLISGPAFASTYDAGTNTITADGTGFNGANGAAFVEDTDN